MALAHITMVIDDAALCMVMDDVTYKIIISKIIKFNVCDDEFRYLEIIIILEACYSGSKYILVLRNAFDKL